MTSDVNIHESITVTEQAANWIRLQLDKRGKGEGIRVGTRPSGCTGYKYVLEFVDQPEDTDILIEEHNVKVFLDPKSWLMLAGTVLEYKTEGLNSGLDFVNPNVTAQCGCGESFTI